MENLVIVTKSELESVVAEQLNKAISRFEERLATMMEQQQPQQKECENLSIEDLCKRWKISKGTVRNYMKSGLIQSVKFNRRVLFPIAEILRAEANGLNRF